MLRIISIGTDQSILEKNSKTFNRVKEYSNLVQEFTILIFTKSKNSKIFTENNFKVVPICGRNKILQVYRLFKYFRENLKLGENYQIFSQDAFEIGLLSLVLSKIYNFRLIVQMHTDISTKFFRQESLRNFWQFLLAKFILKHADRVRVVSTKMKIYLENTLKISKEKIFLLPIYVDITSFNFQIKDFRNHPKILMISRIEEVKNIPLGIKAVQAFRKISGQDIKLRIVGKGGLKEKYLKTYKDKKFIEWADWTDDVQNEFHNADLTLITSNYEGWGLTAVESVASGTPVAILPVGVANEFIIDGVNGFVARFHDTINIMEAIYKSLNFEFDENKMKASLMSLDTKEEYLNKLQKIFSIQKYGI